jgi:hypothetical protein
MPLLGVKGCGISDFVLIPIYSGHEVVDVRSFLK